MTFDVDKNTQVECQTLDTRNGFKHVATFYDNYRKVATSTCYYINRTWERYEYESVLLELANNEELSNKQQVALLRYAKNYGGREDDGLKSIAWAARLGDILTDSKKESNDWKARMLMAGLSTQGLQMPEDWDTLTEEEKTKRLDGAIEAIS